MSQNFDVEYVRNQFPALSREVAGRPAAFLDGPAGGQVPRVVLDAMVGYLTEANANAGGLFPTSRESDAILQQAHQAAADFVGSDDPDLAAFGPNMTTLTLGLARALSRTWKAGDEVLVTSLEHDANFTPWVQAAEDAGATVQRAGIRSPDCTLDLEDLASKLSERTRLVAVTAASNATGTLTPIAEIVRKAHEVGALVFVDAVHRAPHLPLDVDGWGCDFLACSAYKFFGPHVGILWGKRRHLEELPAYKLRPSCNDLPHRWMTGTQNHEGIAGTLAAIDYLASLGSHHGSKASDRRSLLRDGFAAIADYERSLVSHLLEGLSQIPEVTTWGITDPRRLDERAPTVSITHTGKTPREMAEVLGNQGIFTWDGNFYALPLTEALGLEPDGLLRIGLLHYNTISEIDRLLEALRRFS